MDGNIRPDVASLSRQRIFASILESNTFSSYPAAPGGQRSGAVPLANWYQNDDEPWNPLSAPADGSARSQALPASFMSYRGRPSASECDTLPPGVLPSDSGYATVPRPSVGDPSVYGDYDQSGETQSMTGRFSDFQIQNTAPDALLDRSPEIYHPPSSFREPSRRAGQNGDSPQLVCPTCQKTVKTKSELTYDAFALINIGHR